MPQPTDVKAATVSATGSAVAQRSRLKSVYYTGNAVGDATFTITDGSGGATLLTITGLTDETDEIEIPGNGILAKNGLFVSALTNVDSLTIFYDG